MKYTIRGWTRSVLAVAMGFVMAFGLSACDFGRKDDGKDDEFDPPLEVGTLTADDFLKTEGDLVKNRKGEEISLRGVNAGGLFVIEQWMNGFQASGPTEESSVIARDFRTTSQVFIDRFGLEGAEELWKNYQENWWSEADFKNCAAMGMNCIRLPFTYMTVDFDTVVSYDNAGDYDFTPLDDFVEQAASYGMYTILDMHGAYGSQNGQDHSGQTIDDAKDVDFYSNPQMIGLTADLWAALAEHYKDNPAVAGYDILNEPGEKAQSTNEKHFAVFDTIYQAIRAKDPDHIVIFESCWEGENLPHPDEYGWENCMYSFHHYTSSLGDNYVGHGTSWNQKITNVYRENFGVPLQMGEFNNYNSAEQWDYTLGLLNGLGWHWESWTYKVHNTWENTAWGIYTIYASTKVNAHTDSYETILQKFSGLKTTSAIHKVEMDGRTLESIMKEYCTAPRGTKLESGNYLFYDSLTDMPLTVIGGIPMLANDRNASRRFIVSESSDRDGTVLITASMNSHLSVSGGNVVLGVDAPSARFYPVYTEYGYAFVSYTTCRYLRLDEDGRLHADGKTLEESAIFYCQ